MVANICATYQLRKCLPKLFLNGYFSEKELLGTIYF